MKRVVVVSDGTFGFEDYASYIKALKRVLEGYRKNPDPNRKDLEPQQVATVAVVDSVSKADEMVEADQADTVIFVSVSMVRAAHRLRKESPHVKVFVLAGKEAYGEPFIIPKCVLINHEAIVQLLEV